MKSQPSQSTIVSIGYQQRNVDELIVLLQRHEVDVVVDVRLTPISRKKGFSKTVLSEALNTAGIQYRHERKLGNPKENREPFRRGVLSARSRYVRHLRNGASTAYDDVIGLAQTERVALLCFERDHDECHRSCILDAASADDPTLTIVTL